MYRICNIHVLISLIEYCVGNIYNIISIIIIVFVLKYYIFDIPKCKISLFRQMKSNTLVTFLQINIIIISDDFQYFEYDHFIRNTSTIMERAYSSIYIILPYTVFAYRIILKHIICKSYFWKFLLAITLVVYYKLINNHFWYS